MTSRRFPLPLVLAVLLLSPAGTGASRWFDPPPAATPTGTPSRPAPSPTATPGPPCEVDVLDREPAVPFDLLAVVEVQSRTPESDPADLVFSASVRACELGGDALVVLWKKERPRSGMAPPRGAEGLLPAPELRAAVIRYR